MSLGCARTWNVTCEGLRRPNCWIGSWAHPDRNLTTLFWDVVALLHVVDASLEMPPLPLLLLLLLLLLLPLLDLARVPAVRRPRMKLTSWFPPQRLHRLPSPVAWARLLAMWAVPAVAIGISWGHSLWAAMTTTDGEAVVTRVGDARRQDRVSLVRPSVRRCSGLASPALRRATALTHARRLFATPRDTPRYRRRRRRSWRPASTRPTTTQVRSATSPWGLSTLAPRRRRIRCCRYNCHRP
jgi:hypothetical protein